MALKSPSHDVMETIRPVLRCYGAGAWLRYCVSGAVGQWGSGAVRVGLSSAVVVLSAANTVCCLLLLTAKFR